MREAAPGVYPSVPFAAPGTRLKLTTFEVGIDRPMFLIAGPCVIEGDTLTQEIAGRLKEITGKLQVPFIFKASYDKANRSSAKSFRGPGIDAGLKVLQGVKDKVGVPVLTDVHEDTPFKEVFNKEEKFFSGC